MQILFVIYWYVYSVLSYCVLLFVCFCSIYLRFFRYWHGWWCCCSTAGDAHTLLRLWFSRKCPTTSMNSSYQSKLHSCAVLIWFSFYEKSNFIYWRTIGWASVYMCICVVVLIFFVFHFVCVLYNVVTVCLPITPNGTESMCKCIRVNRFQS